MTHEARTAHWSIRKLKGEVKKDFQKMIRYEAADIYGNAQCISCGKWGHVKSMDGGHFISAERNATCFDENNVWPQCKHCNQYLHGNQEAYRANLVLRLGVVVVDGLVEKSKQKRKFERDELLQMRKEFRARWKQAEPVENE